MISFRDIQTLFRLMTTRPKGNSHAERLDSFYGPQAAHYDAFRWRILHGRPELYRSIELHGGEVWADFGGGTAENFEALPEAQVRALSKVHIIDLCSPLLKIAEARVQRKAWTNFELHPADATTNVLPESCCDVVTFSYSLTMIPDWFAALEQAQRILKPGGTLAVVDFYVARSLELRPALSQSWWRRTVFPAWLAFDGVWLSPDHGPYLLRHFAAEKFQRVRARFPKTPIHTEYYHFIGRKK